MSDYDPDEGMAYVNEIMADDDANDNQEKQQSGRPAVSTGLFPPLGTYRCIRRQTK
jgi:hypothetical protein